MGKENAFLLKAGGVCLILASLRKFKRHWLLSAPFLQMVAVNSSSPVPPGMWEAQAMGDAGAIGDSSAESLYVQGKQAQG